MRVLVFVRPVHNPALPIEASSVRVLEELPGYAPVPNAPDELALETALRLRESASFPVTVTVCAVGGESARRVLREMVSCGADEAVCVEAPDREPDPGVAAACLREQVRPEPFDLYLSGAKDLDTGACDLGPMFAALAGIPYLDSVVDTKWCRPDRLDVTRKEKRLREEIRVALPVCLGILRGAPLRYPSFWGKCEAERSPVLHRSPGDTPRTARLERKKLSRPKPKRGSVAEAFAATSSAEQMRQALGIAGPGGQKKGDSLLKGEPEESVDQILEILQAEKVIDLDSAKAVLPAKTGIPERKS